MKPTILKLFLFAVLTTALYFVTDHLDEMSLWHSVALILYFCAGTAFSAQFIYGVVVPGIGSFCEKRFSR